MVRRTVAAVLSVLLVLSFADAVGAARAPAGLPSSVRVPDTIHPSSAETTAQRAFTRTEPRALRRPGRPRTVRARPGDRSVTVSWRRPTSSGARPITGYRIQRRSGETWITVTTVAAPVRRFTIGGLTNGTSQSVRVAAVSAAGVGRAVGRTVVLPTSLSVAIGGAVGDAAMACAVTPARTVMCWGTNERGALGIGTNTIPSLPLPIEVRGLTDVAEVGIGDTFACARTRGGTVWCWGSDEYGQIVPGVGDVFVPTQVVGVSGARSLSVGGYHSCAVLADRTARCWGNNGYGTLGIGGTGVQNAPVEVQLTDIAQISAGLFHTCAVRTDRTLWCWGDNAYDALGVSGADRPSPTQVPGITNAVEVAAGGSFTCVRLADGNARCAGRNTQGQAGNASTSPTPTFTPVVDVGTMTSIESGLWSTCASYTDGVLRCWGDNSRGALGIDEPATASKSAPTAVVGLGAIRSFDVGDLGVCARQVDGHVACVGANDDGQLGIGTISASVHTWQRPIGL